MEPLPGGHAENQRVSSLGWRADERQFHLVAEGSTVAMNGLYNDITSRSGFLGFSRVLKFEGSAAHQSIMDEQRHCQLDFHQLRELTGGLGFDGKGGNFLATISAWIA